MPKFSMQDYTGVNDRMKLAADTWQSITVAPPVMLTDMAGYVMATVTLKDGRSVTETAAFRLGLTGASAQANFPIEDAATSAVGRALGRFGFGTDANFPSREEMEQVERVKTPPAHQQTINANLKRKAEVTPEQAKRMFYDKFPRFKSWADVCDLLDWQRETPKPETVEQWREVWEFVRAALASQPVEAAA